jgi:hypothetical protein
MVPGSCQRRDDYYHDPHYTRRPADRREWSRRRRAMDRQRYRTIEIQAGGHTITAADPLPDDLHNALKTIHASVGAH